jgi:hypothetical protein
MQVFTVRRKWPDREWTSRMIALTSDFHVFASRITTRFPAVLFSSGHNAKARYVCAHSFPWIRHYGHLLIRHYFCPSLSPLT